MPRPETDDGSGPRVSVITPTFDRLALLQEAVESVRRQTLTSWEHLVVDDASTDGTAEWLAAQTDPRLRVITHAVRSERCAARNHALEIARGEYVLHLDHDDRLRRGALGHLAAFLDAHPDAVAAGGSAETFDDTETRRKGVWRARYGDLFPEALCYLVAFPSGMVLYRASALREAGPQDDRFIGMEDLEVGLRVLALGPAGLSPQIVLEHRGGSSFPRPDEETYDGLRREAQRAVVERLGPARRREAEHILRGYEELMRARGAIGGEHPARAIALTVQEIRRNPGFWLGRGRKLPAYVIRRALRRAGLRTLRQARP